MLHVRPIFRIFDEEKAKEFYVDWLGFTIDWEHRFAENSPLYMQVSLGELVLHLSGHHGDCTPGARIHIEQFPDLRDYHKRISAKNYKHNKPGLEKAFWDPKIITMEVIDPFGNRISFTGN